MAGLNRSKYVERDYTAGKQEVAKLGIALAELCDFEVMESLVNHFAAINEFGGEVYIAANRAKVNRTGKVVETSEPGTFTTLGYLIAYNSRSQVKGAIEEPDAPHGTVTAPVEIPEADLDEPEPEHVGPDPEREPVEVA